MVGRIPDSPSLMEQAASGSTDAQIGLVRFATEAAETGTTEPVEALAAAEAWARLAAATGKSEAQHALVYVLLTRAGFETRRSAQETAAWYRGEARRVARALAAGGDADAIAALADLGETQAPETIGPDEQVTALLRLGSQGDLNALTGLTNTALASFYAGEDPAVEALAIAESYARLGATLGDPVLTRLLAAVLLKRAELEYTSGDAAIGNSAVAEAATLTSDLVECGERHLTPWLEFLVENAPKPALRAAAGERASILRHVQPEGTC